MAKTADNDSQRSQKKAGTSAAIDWIQHADPYEQVRVAACELKYGELLDGLINEGFQVPSSEDRDYSWGFYNRVKHHVTSLVRKYREQRRD